MERHVAVRPAREDDFPALSRIDLTYETGRVLTIERSGAGVDLRLELSWRDREPGAAVYAAYDEVRLRDALGRADAFYVAEVDGRPAGLLMIVVPPWTDAAEITDLAVDRGRRRNGAGRTLLAAAEAWARARGLRALWVEPRSDNAAAIEFYLSLGFRLSGFNDRMYSNRDDVAGRTTLWMYLDLGDVTPDAEQAGHQAPSRPKQG